MSMVTCCNWRTTHQTDHFDPPLVKFRLKLGKGTEFGRAYWGEVGGMREENGPAVSDELVEINFAMGGLSLEVWSYRKKYTLAGC